jgi:iron complex outermembrane recepter protein
MSIISKVVRAQLSGRERRFQSNGPLCAMIVTCAGAWATFGNNAARADDANPPPAPHLAAGDVLEEIVVTARYREENLQATPISITALTGQDLESRGMTNITDLTAAVPNTTLVKLGATGGEALVAYVRGVGQASHALAFQPGVPIYIDDIYQPTAYGSFLTLGDVDSVNILRGPQGTLFGKNSEGGAVVIRSVDPKGDDSGYVEAGAGNYSDRRFKGAFDTALIQDTLLMRVAAGNERSDGYVTRVDYACAFPDQAGNIKPTTNEGNCKVGTEGGVDETFARLALKWLATDDLIVRLSAYTTQDNDEVVPEVPLIINPAYPGSDLTAFNNKVAIPLFGIPVSSKFISSNPYVNYATFVNPALGLTFSPTSPQRTWDLTGKVDWDLGAGIHFTSISGFHDLHGSITEYKDGPIPINMIHNDINYSSYTEEDRFSGKLLDNRLEWTAGVYYFHGSGLQLGHIDLVANQVGQYFGLNEILRSPTTDEDRSGYLHFLYHITDQLSLEAGARYSHDLFKYQYGGTNLVNIPAVPIKVVGSGVFGPNPINVESTTSRVDPKVALQYQWTEQLMTYAQYSSGFKGGGTNPNPINAAQATPFGVESLKAYEIGAKSEFFDHRVTVNADGYYNDVRGLQLVGFGTSSVGGVVTVNAGHAVVKGAELEINAIPIKNLLVNASAGYLDFKYHSLGAAALSAQNPGGVRLSDVAPYSPTFKENVGVQYTVQLWGAGTLTPRLDDTYQSRIYFDPQNVLASSQGGYSILNSHLTWHHPRGKLSVAVDVNNVTNKLYYLSKFNQLQSFGILTGQPGEPRKVIASFKYSF